MVVGGCRCESHTDCGDATRGEDLDVRGTRYGWWYRVWHFEIELTCADQASWVDCLASDI